MEGIIVIAVIWFVFNFLMKGLKAANPSGRQGQAPPGGARPRPSPPPLTPTVRPDTGTPDWGGIMTMLGGEAQPLRPGAAEGESTDFPPSGSLTGPTMMGDGLSMSEGSPSAFEGPGALGSAPSTFKGYGSLEGGFPAMGAGRPGEASVKMPSAPEAVGKAPPPPARPGGVGPATLRDAVIWAEILAKPKSLRRVVR